MQAQFTFINAAEKGTLTADDIAAAVASGVDVNGTRWGETALRVAVVNQFPVVVAALLAAGADVNAKDAHGGEAVLWCVYNGSVEMLQLLVDSGGSVNAADSSGCTPLAALVLNDGDLAAARLSVLLACPELELDAVFEGNTAEQWALQEGCGHLAAAIATEVCSLTCTADAIPIR